MLQWHGAGHLLEQCLAATACHNPIRQEVLTIAIHSVDSHAGPYSDAYAKGRVTNNVAQPGALNSASDIQDGARSLPEGKGMVF